MTEEKGTLESHMKEFNALILQMESCPLEESLELYERAKKLKEQMEEELNAIEVKIRELDVELGESL